MLEESTQETDTSQNLACVLVPGTEKPADPKITLYSDLLKYVWSVGLVGCLYCVVKKKKLVAMTCLSHAAVGNRG